MRDILCFHKPEEENGWLSNWWLSEFHIEDKLFTSTEQYMMYKKAATFGDDAIAKQILDITDVGKIKELGRQVKNYNDIVWNGLRQIIVFDGLCAKFMQNSNLRKNLIDTDSQILAECAVNDRIWGIGLSMTDTNRFDMTKWRGQNLLGFTLMQVRNRVKSV